MKKNSAFFDWFEFVLVLLSFVVYFVSDFMDDTPIQITDGLILILCSATYFRVWSAEKT